MAPADGLRPTEEEAFILEFLSPDVQGFHGRFKSKWQDFHVHEIDREGVELHLSELITPGAVAAELRKTATERREARAALGPNFDPDPEVLEDLKTTLGDSAEHLLSFLRLPHCPRTAMREDPSAQEEAGHAPAEVPGYVDLDADTIGDGSKQARKAAHQVVLKHFGAILNTETVDSEGGVRLLRVWLRDAEQKVKSQATPARDNRSEKHGGKAGKGGKGKGKKGAKGKKGNRDEEAQAAVSEFGTLRREGWPKDRPDYLYFRLYKEDCSTAEAVSNIAKCVGRSVKQFSFAGTKDRRASTVQLVCAHRLPLDQLRRTVVHRQWDRRVRISDLDYRKERLRLGHLSGNRFRVVLRGVPATAAEGDAESHVSRAFRAVNSGGFLNYFGLQRFGTREVRTHQVGAAIIAGRWEDAVRGILGGSSALSTPTPKESSFGGHEHKEALKRRSPQDSEEPPSKRTRGESAGGQPRWQQIQEAADKYLVDGDPQKALDEMPKSQHLERCILGALARGLPPAEALRSLPHQAVSLYAHAAQSLVFNAALSRRIQDLGRSPSVGDLILINSQAFVANGEVGTLLGDDVLEESEESDGELGVFQLPAVRGLGTQEEADAIKLTDVVLPLPGSDVTYPSNMKSVYEDLAQKLLGLSLEDFANSRLVTLTGSYRSVAVLPSDLEWQVVQPSDVKSAPGGVLLDSDVARLLQARAQLGAQIEETQNTLETEAEPGDLEPQSAESLPNNACKVDPGPAAVVVSCVLPPSAYLTMMLREVTKQSTASSQLSS